jgi:predicted Zn-dependent protease
LRTLEDDGSTDSAVHYILGLILSSRGEREAALARLARAAELEPEYPLYHFRLAETLHALGRDPRPALDRARALDPRHAWANNLEGQLRLEQGDPASAVGPLTAAREAAPAEIDIGLNLSEALSLTARHSEALETLARLQPGSRDGARVANQRGNVLARAGDPARAAQEYEAAIRQDPATPAYKENCAAACIELDMVHRAEELLAQVEPDHPSPSVYNLLGQVAVLKGERARAEAAYAAGLARAPGHPDLTVNLALLLRERGRVDAARELLAGFLSAHRGGGSARARDLLDRIRAESDRRICCASCGRQWWAPKQLPPQPALRIRGEPPADAPAGQCPQCAKVYCVGCASSHVRELRFVCPEHGEALRLADDGLKWLLARALEAAESGARDPPANPSP